MESTKGYSVIVNGIASLNCATSAPSTFASALSMMGRVPNSEFSFAFAVMEKSVASPWIFAGPVSRLG